MKIISFKLTNFRGIESLEVNLDGKDGVIYGANGAGKTTVANAVCWLLTGKSATGEKNFSPKTIGVHKAEHIAEAVFTADDGVEIMLKKVFTEKWKKPRGKEPVLAGHETTMYVNGAKAKDSEYTSAVEHLAGGRVDNIDLLTITGAFTEALAQKERRAILFGLYGKDVDSEMLADSRWANINAMVKRGMNFDNITAAAKDAYKQAERNVGLIPTRITALADSKMPVSVSLDEAESKLETNKVTISKLQQEYAELVKKGDAGEGEALRREVDELHGRINSYNADVAWHQGRIENWQKELADLRVEFANKVNRVWDNNNAICPCCGQVLPADKLEAAKAKFEADRQTAKVSINAKGSEVLGLVKRAEAAIKEIHEKKALCQQAIALVENKIQNLPTQEDNTIKRTELKHQIEELQIANEELVSQIGIIKVNASIDEKIAIAEVQRKEELKNMDLAEKQLYEIEQFSQERARLTEEAINKNFASIKFKLFEPQLNGGFKDVCEPMIPNSNGELVDYKSANTAAQVNANLEIMESLAKATGANLPIFIDGAERISNIRKMDCQTVALVVSPQDSKLRVDLKEE